jgi:HSP20 family protein
MAIIPWQSRKSTTDDLSILNNLRTEMNRVFDNFFREPFGSMTESLGWGQVGPSIDVSESDAEITLQAELPGVDPKDLDITVTADRVTISGEKKETVEKSEKSYHQKEIRTGKFTRTLALPSSVDPDHVSAEYKNGILSVRLKKHQMAAGRKVAVSTES